VFQLAGHLFRYAQGCGVIAADRKNPAEVLDAESLGVENNTRSRYLTETEITQLWHAHGGRCRSPTRS
jgi:hypothetical protein